MKILFDNFIFELQKAGGISKVWFNIIKRTPKNVEAYFIENDIANNIFRKELHLDQKMIRRKKSILSHFNQYLSVSNKNYDIYHSSYFRPLKNKGKTKVVVTVHDFIYEKYSGFLQRKNHLFIKKRALKQADAIICVSQHTKKDFLEYYPNIKPENVYVVHNGVDDEFKPTSHKDVINISNLKLSRNKFLLYVGSRGYCKNFDFVIKLLNTKLVKDLNFKLICVGGGSFNKSELNIFEELKIKENVFHLDKVSNPNLNSLYNHAFCLLFPSIYEGFGIPALEAMKVGCPIWSTNSSSVAEIIGKQYPVQFSPTNWEEAFSNFKKLLDDEVRDLSINVGLLNANNFSWDKCAHETFNIYQSILDK